jgi:hemolysin activation/secretion protein
MRKSVNVSSPRLFAQSSCVLAIVASLGSAAHAQQQQVPGTVQPGPILRAERPPPSTRAEPSDRERQGFRPIPAPQPGEVAFVLQGIQLDGATPHAPPQLFEEVTALMRKSVTLSQLQVAAENISVRYRNAGFLLAQAFIPVQTIQDGVVKIRVIEGEFASCRFEGEAQSARSLLQRYADQLCTIRPMNVASLERYLLLMNDIPGVQAQGIIVPAAVQGANPDLLIRVSRRNHDASIGISNRESKTLGTWRADAEADLYGAFGLDGRQWVRYRHTPGGGLNLAAVGQELPLGHEGAKWGVSLLGSRTTADLSGVPVRSELSALNLNLTYPWLRRRTYNLTVRGTFSAVNTNSDLDGVAFNEDRVRSLRLGVTYDFVDRARGANVFDVEVSHGINAFGANPTGPLSASRPDGRSDYTKLNFYTARLQPILPRLSVLAALQAQYTDQPLLLPEQFALGGEQFLRAYDAAELLGDRGYGLKIELRYALTASGSATAYGFYDYGRVYTNASPLPGQDAASAGMGLRLTLWRRLNAYVEGAVPIGRDVTALGNRNPRAFGGLQLAF